MINRSFTDDARIATDVQHALNEDIGSGDLTAQLIPASLVASASILCRENAVLCGRAWVEAAFRQVDGGIRLTWHAQDGDRMRPEMIVCEINGHARGIVTAERTALNFLQTLSGTATSARRFADAVDGLPVKLLDTRKTVPGLRAAQKYAVRCGGCENHRQGLFDALLIKENHIAAAGGIRPALAAAALLAGRASWVQVEVETLDQLHEAVENGAKMILLDNMTLEQMREAVRWTAGRASLEASGGITLDNVRAIAETGVDRISIGALTKDIAAIDLSMRFDAA
jgi:nicotinate-nucleotide pyrophosphorylase (carboxylating)